MLWRSHEHYRDLHAGFNTAISTPAANCDQDRYVMITVPTSHIQNADLSCWSSISHAGARANARCQSQIVHRSALLKADTCLRGDVSMPGNLVEQAIQLP